MSRLLDALSKSVRYRDFECPRTGLSLRAHAPTRRQQLDATRLAYDDWGKRDTMTMIGAEAFTHRQTAHLLAACITLDDQPIGLEAVDALDEATFLVYVQAAQAVQSGIDVPAESWTDDEFQALRDGLKKKESRYQEALRLLDGDLLARFIGFLENQQSMPQT